MTHEGEFKPQEREWQTANNTYSFSNGLGVVEIIIALLVLANPLSRWLGLIGGVLAFATPIVTLSFNHHAGSMGYAAGRSAPRVSVFIGGRATSVKDTLMLAGAVMIIADSARSIVKQQY